MFPTSSYHPMKPKTQQQPWKINILNPKKVVFGDEIILFKLGEFEVFGVPEFSVVNPNKLVIWKISEELQNLWHPNLVGK